MDFRTIQTFDAALFDLDGTLVDTEPVLYRAWTELVRREGGDFSAFDYADIIGLPDIECARIVSGHYGYGKDPVAWYEEYAVIAREIIDRGLELRPGAALAIERLEKAGYAGRLALVTSAMHAHAEQALHGTGLFEKFSAVITADSPGLTARKPAPDPYLAAAAALGIAPTRAIAFEDTPTGVRSARAAGCLAYAIPHRFSPKEGLAEADIILTSLSEFDPANVPPRP